MRVRLALPVTFVLSILSVAAANVQNADRAHGQGCADARRELARYSAAVRHWRKLQGGGHHPAERQRKVSQVRPADGCPAIRRRARAARARAQEERRSYGRWSYQYDWRQWLPPTWRRIGWCETRLTWTWNSGSYQGAFGFYFGTWDSYRPGGFPGEAYQATPREQYVVALRVYADRGYGAWGCGRRL